MNDPAVLLAMAVSVGFLGAVGLSGMRSLLATARPAARWVLPRRTLHLLLVFTALVAIPRARPGRAEVPPPIVRLGDIRPAPVPADAMATYTVVPGDSLWRIAGKHLEAMTGSVPRSAEIDRFWRRIYAENEDLIGDDPDLIFPGQRFRIPTEVDRGT